MAGLAKSITFLEVFFVFIFLLFARCKSTAFTIERINSGPDLIPNNVSVARNGSWITIPCRSSCSAFNTQQINGSGRKGCQCQCKNDHSTFRMGRTGNDSSCIKNVEIGAKEDWICAVKLANQTRFDIPVIDMSRAGSKNINKSSCSSNITSQYWDKGHWTYPLMSCLFSFNMKEPDKLKWLSGRRFTGKIIKLNICLNDTGIPKTQSCIILKIQGSLTYVFDYGKKPTAWPTTTFSTPLYSSSTKGTTPYLETTTGPRTNGTSGRLTNPSTVQMPASTVKSTIGLSPESVTGPPKTSNGVIVAVISASAAVVCVVIIALLLWRAITQKKRQRTYEAYSADMTVITNAANQNNSPPAMKNAAYEDAEYCYPYQQQKPGRLTPRGTSSIISWALPRPDSEKYVKNSNLPWGTRAPYSPQHRGSQEDSLCGSDYEGIYEVVADSNVGGSTYQPLFPDRKVKRGRLPSPPTIPEYLTILPDNDTPMVVSHADGNTQKIYGDNHTARERTLNEDDNVTQGDKNASPSQDQTAYQSLKSTNGDGKGEEAGRVVLPQERTHVYDDLRKGDPAEAKNGSLPNALMSEGVTAQVPGSNESFKEDVSTTDPKLGRPLEVRKSQNGGPSQGSTVYGILKQHSSAFEGPDAYESLKKDSIATETGVDRMILKPPSGKATKGQGAYESLHDGTVTAERQLDPELGLFQGPGVPNSDERKEGSPADLQAKRSENYYLLPND